MTAVSLFGIDGMMPTVRRLVRPRDIFLHDGMAMRRIHLSIRNQTVAAAAFSVCLLLSLFAMLQIVGTTTGLGRSADRSARVSRMSRDVASMQSDIVRLRAEAAAHAARIEARQAFLAAVLTGKGSPVLPAGLTGTSAMAAPVVAPYARVEGQQTALAALTRRLFEQRYAETSASLRKLGIRPEMGRGGMGGPYEPIDAGGAKSAARPDPVFRALFQSWKRLDQLQQGVISIPSQKPVEVMEFTSGFGVRSDPFRGGAAMHAGVDIPGASGTTIYATADGVVLRSERAGGYGNLVEIDHGRGIQTRYGHLSASLVTPGQRVRRGDPIARMGSTGRSTGTHLHYEVRLDGHAVNPMPFLQSANYLAAMQARGKTAMGGPDQ